MAFSKMVLPLFFLDNRSDALCQVTLQLGTTDKLVGSISQ